MATGEFEVKRIEMLVGQLVEKRRPAAPIRSQVDLAFRVVGQSFEIYEIRSRWNDPSKSTESPIAKATYIKSQKVWKLFWMKADMKWHSYSALPASESLEEILREIDTDASGCFWG